MPNILKTPTLQDYEIRLLIHNQWKQKIPPKQATKNLNLLREKDIISYKKVNSLYSQFDQGNMDIFEENSGLHVYSSSINKKSQKIHEEKPNNLLGSLLELTDDDYFYSKKSKRLVANNGRFFIFTHQNKEGEELITIYDLFKRKMRSNPVSSQIFRPDFILFGQYLLFTTRNYPEQTCEFSAFKIDFNDLSVKELNFIDINFYYRSILTDGFYGEKFVICFDDKFLIGQIENDKISLNDTRIMGQNLDMRSKRLIGNKIQGLANNYDVDALKFCKINLDTMEKTEINAKIELDSKLDVRYGNYRIHCWSLNFYYEFLKTENNQFRLLSFDTKAFKWNDVRIWTLFPQNIFTDENDVLTLRVGHYRECYAHYRINLRKPDTLINLTMLKTVKESNLYGNGKYVNVMNSLPVNL